MKSLSNSLGLFTALTLAASFSATACGGDNDNDNDGGTGTGGGGSSATGGGSSTGGSNLGGMGGDGSGGGDTGPTGSCGFDKAPYLLGGGVTTQDGYQGYLSVVDDIGESADFDFSAATAFPVWTSHHSYADGTAFVGSEGSPILEKWVVNSAGELEKAGEISLENQGVTETASVRGFVARVNDTKAYYLDKNNHQLIGFNPETMLLDGVIVDLSPAIGPYIQDQVTLGGIQRDGDTLIITARYWTAEGSTDSVVKAAFVDSTDDSLTAAEDTRCGGLAFFAKDSAGNTYVGPHQGNLYEKAVDGWGPGLDSCVLRIKKGEKQFDPDYYVNLDDVVDGLATNLADGAGDKAYFMKYEGEIANNENWRDLVRFGTNYDLYEFTLGEDDPTATKVELPNRVTPFLGAFCSDEETVILGLSEGDTGFLLEIAEDGTLTRGMTYEGDMASGAALE